MIKAFTPEELEGARFSDDYEWIKIQGENYHVMVSHVGDFNELDADLPDLPWETRILRVFTEENYKEFAEIMTIEGLESTKKNLVIPIYEGRVAVYSNEDDSLVKTFTAEECKSAEISENSQVVRIAGELYMVTYDFDGDYGDAGPEGGEWSLVQKGPGGQLPGPGKEQFTEGQGLNVHPSGKYLYNVTNGTNTVDVFALGDDGKVTLIQSVHTDHAWPRGQMITPDGRFLLLSCSVAGKIIIFSIGDDGMLTPTGNEIDFENAECMTLWK